MIEVFELCLKVAYAFKGSGISAIPDMDQLERPLKKYIADHVYRLTLGVTPYSIATIICNLLEHSGMCIETEINLNDFGAQSKISLEEICRKGKILLGKSGKFSSVVLNQATTVYSNLDAALRRRESVLHLKESINIQSATIKNLQLISAAHVWLHEEVISGSQNLSNANSISRSNFVQQLKLARKNLTAWKSTIDKMRDEIMTCIATAMQRVKWAAGANPAHSGMLEAFEKQSSIKRDELDKNCLLAAVALKACISILNYETMKNDSPENFEFDQLFLNHVSRWEKCCTMSQTCSNAVSPIEEAIVELLDPEGTIDIIWLNNVKALLNDMTEQTEENLNQYEKQVVNATDNLQKCGHKLRQLMGIHHQLASDVISLLKITIKSDSDHSLQIKEYLGRYKQFIELLSEVHGTILSKDFTEENVSVIMKQLGMLEPICNGIYNDLLLFENGLKDIRADDEDRDNSTSPTKNELKNEKPIDGFYNHASKRNKGMFESVFLFQ